MLLDQALRKQEIENRLRDAQFAARPFLRRSHGTEPQEVLDSEHALIISMVQGALRETAS